VGRSLLVVLLAAVAVAIPGQARAAVPLTPCKTNGVQCATVQVPLDRSGVAPGTISLHVEVRPATGQPRGVAFLIAGGPGQGSASSFDLSSTAVQDIQFMLPGYTLVAFDNRGTGASGLIRCPALQAAIAPSPERGAALAAGCAASIGAQRVFYATRDHAEDIEAVRQALGLGKIALYGVSYGTKLSLAYALAHPDGVERLILDSMVAPTFPDPFDRNVLQQMPGTLTNFCGGGRCRGATPNYSADVVALANRLEARPAAARVLTPSGARRIRMNGEDLLTMMIDSDLSPGLAAEAPAAIHAARGGNVRPLLRLWDLDMRSSKLSAEDLSFGLNAATNCADGRFPWDPSTPPAGRRAVINSAIARLLPGSLGPFGSWAARLGTAFFCEQWPTPSGNTPLAQGPYPNVPVLAINGGYDMRTPTANALAVVDQFPQGRLVVVPGVGHSVLTADISGCSQNAVRAWILGTLNAPTRAMCPRVPSLVKVVGAFPKRPAGPTAATTFTAVKKTLREAESTWLQVLFSAVQFVPRGLYGGKLVNAKQGLAFTLTRYAVAPGVFVSGKVTFATVGPPIVFKGRVRVSGPAAAAGTVRITSNTLVGTLGGRRVRGSY
jgi:pimeloyl-ACP methyl ester carboxylesterase